MSVDLGVHTVAEVEEGSLAYTMSPFCVLSIFFLYIKIYIYSEKSIFSEKNIGNSICSILHKLQWYLVM